MQNSPQPGLITPSLPSGGGSMTGLAGNMAGAGPDGAVSLSVPLPVSAGRGYAPSLTLNYHSRAGNGPFGMGWNTNQIAIRRRTRKGAPAYSSADEFTGPDGEVLVPWLTENGKPDTRSATTLLDTALDVTFSISTWRSRTEGSFSRLEYWVAQNATSQDFWVMYEPDGQVHLLGHNHQARISNPQDVSQTAAWLIESSVSATGEQIWYQYRAEDEVNCPAAETLAHPASRAQRYLVAAWYGNRVAGRILPGLTAEPVASDWLFTLVLDYGERTTDPANAPGWLAPGTGNWLCRQDAHSGYEYGFDIRTRRLCRQVLMFHRIATLAGTALGDDTPLLVSRLLLDYDESPPVTMLKTLRQAGYESDGTACVLPPLEFGWQCFTPPESPDWVLRDDLGKMNLLQPYQLVDLNGEGLAGVLYQDGGAWRYRAPVRQPGDDPDAVTWDKPAPLPSIPTLRDAGVLTDLNGDGRLEWVVTAPGVAGHYHRTPEREWLHFTPLSALPVEYAHPRAQLADILGAGLSDMVLIGPRSVRLYAGEGDGWKKGETVLQSDGITLPIPGADACTLVAFSDMLGSGQQHLVQVRADGVRCWPNLGHGRFAPPVDLPGFSQPADRFNPDRLYLADIDGSGTTDLIYALTDRLEVSINRSGNHFAEPFSVKLPDGVRYDRTCSLQLADIQGLGVASLVLTVPHPVPRSWVCHLSAEKPWLLNGMNNSMGAAHNLHYRSSAQFWLDEKADAVAANNAVPACYLPFAVHLLETTQVTDEITGNKRVSKVRYRHGVWDGKERELRGFACVEMQDTDTVASRGTAAELALPSVSRNWYATGFAAVDDILSQEYWQGDTAAFAAFMPRFTSGSGEDEKGYTPDEATAFWLQRALQGMPLRSELYGKDGSAQADVPYSVTESRPQVRLVQSDGAYPVVLPTEAESRSWTYERISSDPQCSQQVVLTSNEYGQPMKQVSIHYPRRAKPASSPYPNTLPDTLFASSYDDQQQLLRLSLQQSSWHIMSDMAAGIWLPGLADATRSDVFIHPATVVPEEGLTLERLLQSDGLLAESHSPVFVGQQQVWYLDAQDKETTGTPAWPPRTAFTETAVFDEDIVQALSGSLTVEQLKAAGYQQSDTLFSRMQEPAVWTARKGYATYATAEHFWLPIAFRESLLTGAITVSRDVHDCVITRSTDAAGLTTQAGYDWRFLVPVRVTDINDNLQTITLDALGRVTTKRISGTENGHPAGYSDIFLTPPANVDSALELKGPLPVAQCLVYAPDSWLNARIPPHILTLSTDRYDSDPEQQIRQQVTFSDGFGRILQAAVRQAEGEAWQQTDEGSLVVGKDGKPQVAQTDFRWAVTGRTEYDNKGQAVRTYQPYFLNSWRYVSDDSARQDLYADTHYYDPPGREYQVVTAKGWLRRSLFTPWFVVSEDENDTLADSKP